MYGRPGVRVLSWNLFHGRAVPSAGRALLGEFSSALAGWAWDVALLQEVPPWWPEPLAAACGARSRRVLTSRNSLLWLRRAIAERAPDLLKASGGGCNAILVRGAGIAEHRTLRLAWLPERRWAHGVRLADGRWVVNLHATAHCERRARPEVAHAAAVALGWAGSAPLAFGGDLNLGGTPELDGLRRVADHGVDHLYARGLAPAGAGEVLDHGRLSDHAPIAVELAP